MLRFFIFATVTITVGYAQSTYVSRMDFGPGRQGFNSAYTYRISSERDEANFPSTSNFGGFQFRPDGQFSRAFSRSALSRRAEVPQVTVSQNLRNPDQNSPRRIPINFGEQRRNGLQGLRVGPRVLQSFPTFRSDLRNDRINTRQRTDQSVRVDNTADNNAPPNYVFEYGIDNQDTGDIKNHHEERDGDSTRGNYTVNEPDGTILIVRYIVDRDSGFNADVQRLGDAADREEITPFNQ